MKVPHHQIVALQKNTVYYWQITIKKCSFKNTNWYQISASSENLWGYTLVALTAMEEIVGLSVLLLFVSICVTVKEISMSDKFHFKETSLWLTMSWSHYLLLVSVWWKSKSEVQFVSLSS